MFANDKEIIIAVIVSSTMMIFLVGIIVAAIVKYQNKSRKHLQELNVLKIMYQEETLKALLEKEEQTLMRISQEIHDNIGQILSLVKLNLNTLDLTESPPEIKNKVFSTKELVGKAINDLRELSKSLNTIHVSKDSLSDSITRELEIVNKTGLYITELTTLGVETTLAPQKQIIIFRIAQEALNNIIKHANATHIFVELNYNSGNLTLQIKDDGIGFNPDNIGRRNSGTGLDNIHLRAELLKAHLFIDSEKGKGTALQLKIPVD